MEAAKAPQQQQPQQETSAQHALNRPANCIQVSVEKSPYFYARIGRRMMSGSAEKSACEEVIITGLGNATKTAVGAAAILEREQDATFKSVVTDTWYSDRNSNAPREDERRKRAVPKITIVMKRNPDGPSAVPEVPQTVKVEA